MSLRTRIHGFTAWVNLRLKPYEELTSNVLMDLLTGTNLRALLQSLTGVQLQRLDSFDSLTQTQKVTRVEWVVNQLKKSKVIPEDVYVDSRLFAMRSANHIFELLWRLVCHDIWFVWERLGYLQQDSDEVLSEVAFKWIPEPPPMKKKVTYKTSLLSGFGASALVQEDSSEDEELSESYDPFPRSEFMKEFKARNLDDHSYPAPEACILEMINSQLTSVPDSRKVHCKKMMDLADTHILCTLINSFVPHTFTTEVLPNDRWTINLILRTMEKMFYMKSAFESEDILEGDNMSVCAYFGAFFMVAYKYRQCYAVISWLDHLRLMKKQTEDALEEMTSSGPEADDQRAALGQEMESVHEAVAKLVGKFDVDFCSKWLEHVGMTVIETHLKIREKFKGRFEMFAVPRSLSVHHLCQYHGINLALTNGIGFCLAEDDTKEVLTDSRKLVIWDKNNEIFIDNFTNKCRDALLVRKLLGLPATTSVIVLPSEFPQFQLFFEVLSRSKILKVGSMFLYQVFPEHTTSWQKLLQKAIRENKVETVKRLMVFFRSNADFVNCRHPINGNTALHLACKLGRYEIVLHLLENGANINMKNGNGQTPLFSAAENYFRDVAHLLIEWGCDVHVRGPKGLTAFESIKTEELREFLIGVYHKYCDWVPRLVSGDVILLENLVREHVKDGLTFNNLRSRCVNGSTLLHTAAHFGSTTIIRLLLGLGVNINVNDYKGASPLHRARDCDTMELLMAAGATPAAMDNEFNSVLHIKCYGQRDCPTPLADVELLLNAGAKLTARNSRMLMPLHCAVMRGRTDIVQALLKADRHADMRRAVAREAPAAPPSVIYLSVVNDCVPCAEWLVRNGFVWKEGEEEILMEKILKETLKVCPREDGVKFLLSQGAKVNSAYHAGNTALHCAACLSGSTDVLDLLLLEGATVNATNDGGSTPLHFACQMDNQHAGGVLIAHGADVLHKNMHGQTALDLITDYDDWIRSGFFDEQVTARLKAFRLKNIRDLVHAISEKVQTRGSEPLMRTPHRVAVATTLSAQSWRPLGTGSKVGPLDDMFGKTFARSSRKVGEKANI